MSAQLPDGYTVKYKHRRRHKILHAGKIDGEYRVLDEKGGTTVAVVSDPDGYIVGIGEATCHPKESYNKRLGRMVSLGRALKNAGL